MNVYIYSFLIKILCSVLVINLFFVMVDINFLFYVSKSDVGFILLILRLFFF